MKLKKNKIFLWFVSMMAVIVIFVYVLESNSEKGMATELTESQPTEHTVNTSKKNDVVTLNMYLIGEAPQGFPEVLETLNERLMDDLNTMLNIQYIRWEELNLKYPAILASGDVDIIYASSWSYYAQQVSRGAFLSITEHMIEQFLPRHHDQLNPKAWDAAKIKGNIYMVPTSTPDVTTGVTVIRQDLREKYGIPPIRRVSELEPYLEAIKKYEANMIPMNLDSQYDLSTPYYNIVRDKIAYPGAPMDSGITYAQGMTYDYQDPSGTIYSMLEEPYLSAQKYAAGIMKKWRDKGYMNDNPYANQVRSKDNFCEGRSAVAFGNSNDIESTLEQCELKGIQAEIIPTIDAKGNAPAASWLVNGLAVSSSSKHPEKSLQVIDLLMEEPEYVYLTYFGIEGKNYVITEDNKIALPDGVTTETNTYPMDKSGFWFVNKSLFLPRNSWPDSYIQHLNEIKKILIPSTYAGFSFNSEAVEPELTAILQISEQYATPIYIGAVEDVDRAFDLLSDKLHAVGLEKVKKEVEKQANQYLLNKNTSMKSH
ncbi:ABC transporter substrate-binding protein [Paenibacillus tundrae]